MTLKIRVRQLVIMPIVAAAMRLLLQKLRFINYNHQHKQIFKFTAIFYSFVD